MADGPDEEPEHTVPPVIRGGQASSLGQDPAAGEPGIVYLPAQRSQQGGALEIELRHLGDDRLVLLAYSSLDVIDTWGDDLAHMIGNGVTEQLKNIRDGIASLSNPYHHP